MVHVYIVTRPRTFKRRNDTVAGDVTIVRSLCPRQDSDLEMSL